MRALPQQTWLQTPQSHTFALLSFAPFFLLTCGLEFLTTKVIAGAVSIHSWRRAPNKRVGCVRNAIAFLFASASLVKQCSTGHLHSMAHLPIFPGRIIFTAVAILHSSDIGLFSDCLTSTLSTRFHAFSKLSYTSTLDGVKINNYLHLKFLHPFGPRAQHIILSLGLSVNTRPSSAGDFFTALTMPQRAAYTSYLHG